MMQRMKKITPESLRWLLQNARGQYGWMLLLSVLSGACACLSVWFALVSREVVDGAMAGSSARVIRAALLLLALTLGENGVQACIQALSERMSARLRLKVQNRMLSTLMEREYSALADFHSGELQNRLFSDVGLVADGMVNLLPGFAGLVFRLAGAAAALLLLSPEFAGLLVLTGAAISTVMMLMRGWMKRLHKDVQSAEGRLRSSVQEMLERLLIIKVFGAARSVQAHHEQLQESYFRIRMKRRRAGILAGTGMSLVFELGYLLALIWGCAGILSGVFTYGTMTALMQLVGQVQSPFAGFSGLAGQLFAVTASAERLMELEVLPKEEVHAPACPDTFQAISFEQVAFTYGRDDAVLSDVTFRINRGDFAAITGVSGEGKSTMLLLMLGMYRASSGSVGFEAEGHTMLPGPRTRSLCTYVPQDHALLAGTVRENLCMFGEAQVDEALWQALALACADEFVRQLPQGLDTLLGEKGHGLSQGQMQRIAIARAILSGAPILLLDEATSALDAATEERFLRNLAAQRQYTCILVTHRQSASRICNRHFHLQGGCLTEVMVDEA